MKPFLALGITSTSVTAINVFDEIVALSGYGDLGKNILMESYLTTFSFLNFGKGSAMTYIVLFFALLLGIFYLRNLNKEWIINEVCEESRIYCCNDIFFSFHIRTICLDFCYGDYTESRNVLKCS